MPTPQVFSPVSMPCPVAPPEDHPLVNACYYWGAFGSVAVGEQAKEIEGGGNLDAS